MAKYNPKHTKDILTFDTTTEDDTIEKHHDRLVTGREKQFEQNDKEIYKDILNTYEEYSSAFDTASDDEQIKVLTRLHQVKEFSGWMIGEFLTRIDDSIKNNRKSQYRDFSDYFIKNEHLLGFGRSAAFNYMAVRRGVSIDQFRRLGVKKSLVMASVPDPVKREEFIQQAMSTPKMTESDLKLIVAEYKQETKQVAQVAKEKENKKIVKTVIYNMTSKGKSIVIEPQTFSIEIMQEALAAFEMQIKGWIKRKLDSED